jgi:hypothetical protein
MLLSPSQGGLEDDSNNFFYTLQSICCVQVIALSRQGNKINSNLIQTWYTYSAHRSLQMVNGSLRYLGKKSKKKQKIQKWSNCGLFFVFFEMWGGGGEVLQFFYFIHFWYTSPLL